MMVERITKFITFYSYKGGVGRTLTLANVAYNIAQSGRRVVVVDFDLEAPGLHHYPFYSGKISRGVVDYISDYVQNKKFPDPEKYLAKNHKDLPNLTIFPAGKCDDDYKKKLAQFDWNLFYSEYYGFDFFQVFKKKIIETCDPDYVLIDSRTGLTDIKNICTLQIPDIVVLVFSLNKQNLEGIEPIYRAIKGFEHPFEADKEITVVPVASPVPEGETTLKINALKPFERIFNEQDDSKIEILPFHPRLAFSETLMKKNMEIEIITKCVSELTTRLTKLHPMYLPELKDKVEKATFSGNLYEAIELQKKITELENSAGAWFKLATLLVYDQQYDESITALNKAIQIDPDDARAHNNKGQALFHLKQYKWAIQCYDKAIKIDPNDAMAYNNKGAALFQMKEYETAIQCYDKAIEIDPKRPAPYYNKARAYSLKGKKQKAVECLKKAANMDSKYIQEAREDSDFEKIHFTPEFRELVGLDDGGSKKKRKTK